MRFVMLMRPSAFTKPGAPSLPDPEAIQQMMIFNNELADSGALISLDGFYPPETGRRVTFSNGSARVSEAPFDDPHPIGGFWMIDVASQDEAVAWAQRVPSADGDIIEIRQVPDMTDFPEPVQQSAASVAAKLAE